MAKLSDTQLIVLSKAAQRDDGAAVVPEKLKGAAAAKVGASLIARELMREVRSKPGMPIWREGEDGRSISLIITRSGRDAIGAEEDRNEPEPAIATKGKKDRLSINATKDANPPIAKARAVTAACDQRPADIAPRSGSKQALIVAMLSRQNGATIDGLIAATGWLPHTTRAALTGLRKRGYRIERRRGDGEGPSVYCIVAEPIMAA